MNEMQRKLVDMLAWFHDFCQKNNFRYYIIAGTMLGAVRHSGFIPWDDDVDVGMPRADYERLREYAKTQKNERYCLEFPGLNNPEYPFLWAKVFDTTTTLVEKQRYKVKRGIYIDIFPIDGIGDQKDIAVKNQKPIKWRLYLNSIMTCAVLKRRKWYKNASIFLGRIICPLFINHIKFNHRLDERCKRYDFDKSAFVGDLLGGANAKGIVPKDYFGNPTLVQFESLWVNGLEKPDLYLTAMYGDYMKLPPKKNQISYHDSELMNLNKGYKEQ